MNKAWEEGGSEERGEEVYGEVAGKREGSLEGGGSEERKGEKRFAGKEVCTRE